MPSKYYSCTVIVEIPESQYKNWSEQSDILFHGIGFLHDPENNNAYLVGYNETTKMALDINKYNMFNEDGGV